MKNVSKNSKLASCFRPVVDIDAMLDSSSSSSSRRFSCVPVSQHKHRIRQQQHHPPNPKPNPKPKPFLLIKFQALLIQTILNKRGSPETRNNNGISKRSQPGVDCKSSQEETKPQPGGAVCDSTHSHSSQCSCSQTEDEEKQSKNEKEKRRRMGYCNCGIYMLLLSLTITVIRDKYWGVLFTSACLFFFCLCQPRHSPFS